MKTITENWATVVFIVALVTIVTAVNYWREHMRQVRAGGGKGELLMLLSSDPRKSKSIQELCHEMSIQKGIEIYFPVVYNNVFKLEGRGLVKPVLLSPSSVPLHLRQSGYCLMEHGVQVRKRLLRRTVHLEYDMSWLGR